jgi:AraC-like DNA-binding protein
MVEESVSGSAGSNVIVDRLSEIVFMYALRHYVITHPGQSGVLSLYAHPRLSIAINVMHKNPERDWTLEVLARQAAQSRTQFAKTFREVSGLTPMEYLTWWRMQLAWVYLSEGDSIYNVAEKIGYKSESSFLRAFKKTFNVNAGQVRKKLVS